jgi:hypothetical protein
MTKLRITNSYTLLGAFLAPEKTDEQIEALKDAIKQEQFTWESLLLQANEQLCTPLWYSQLSNDNLLSLLPEELQQYLQTIYELNLSRNRQMKEGLEEFLAELQKENIDSLLLKGAATFYDNLYGNIGSRVMGDLDILVPEESVEICRDILLRQGFEEIPDPNMAPIGQATDERHHQIPRHHKPDTPIVIEIHFKTSYAQAGRCLTTSETWKHSKPIQIDTLTSRILEPTERLILNTAHALFPHREFIRGEISLLQLAEFAHLENKYGKQIDWDRWHRVAEQQNIRLAFYSYAMLARRIMGVNAHLKSKQQAIGEKQLPRLIASHFATEPPWEIKFYSRAYYFIKLPGWIWKNVCYAPGIKNFPARVRLFLNKLVKAQSWTKI